MKLYQDLHIDVPLFIKGFDFENTPDDPWVLFDPKFISNELKDMFSTLNLSIKTVGLFTTFGWISTTIHLDGHLVGNVAKLNWVQSTSDDHLMNWYTIKEQKEYILLSKDSNNNLPGRDYINFLPNEVDLIDSKKIAYPTLVNVGIPHNIKNLGGKRKCISIAIYHKDKTISMEDAIEFFKKYI